MERSRYHLSGVPLLVCRFFKCIHNVAKLKISMEVHKLKCSCSSGIQHSIILHTRMGKGEFRVFLYTQVGRVE